MFRRLAPLLVAACGGHAVPATPPPTPPASALIDAGAGAAVLPQRQRVELALDPNAPEYDGSVEIDVLLDGPTTAIALDADGLTIDQATVAGQAAVAATDGGTLTLTVPQTLQAGPTTIAIRFHGRLGDGDAPGLNRHGPAIFAAFDPDGAHHAFPCFDDPEAKIPWRVTLVVPRGETALGNAPAETSSPASARVRVSFAETRPLPPHLVAVAVGPFELVSAGRVGGVTLRLAVPPGRGAHTQELAQAMPPLLAELASQTGAPYPYPKLDVVLGPRVPLGEQPGLLVLTDELLVPPDELHLERRQAVAGLVAHVLTHQWLGDSVSRRDLYDPWQEPVIAWLARRALAAVHPDWRVELARVVELGRDEPLARASAIVELAASRAGAERTAEVLRRFVADHADGVAEFGDLIAALAPDIADGAPDLAQGARAVVNARLVCDGPARLVVETDDRRPLPLCATWPAAGGTRRRECTRIKGRAELALAGARGCPAWALAGDGAEGLLRVAYTPELFGRLVRATAALTTAERLALALDARAFARAGVLPLGDALALVPALAGDAAPEVVDAAIALLREVRAASLPPGGAAAYRALAGRLFGRRARALGVGPRPGEPTDATRMRPTLLAAAVELAADVTVTRGLGRTAEVALDRPGAVNAALAQVALRAAARTGKRPLFDRLLGAARADGDGGPLRPLVISALGHVTDLSLANETLAFVRDGAGAEAARALAPLLETVATRDLAWTFVDAQLETLMERAGSAGALRLLALPGAFCDKARREAAEKRFTGPAATVEGGPERLAAALARARGCEDALRRDLPGAIRFLR